jgi:ribonuclease PH
MTRPTAAPPISCRPITFERDFTEMADGSCSSPSAAPVCCAPPRSTTDVPRWMKGKGKGWVTAEYSMLPGSSPERVDREAAKGKQSGRTVEIQRLIGRSLRAACDMTCSASARSWSTATCCRPTAARARQHLRRLPRPARRAHPGSCSRTEIGAHPRTRTARPSASASSTARPCSTCPYVEDSAAEVDMNVVMWPADASATEPRSWRCRAPPRAWRSPAASSTPCSASPRRRRAGDLRPAGRVRGRAAGTEPATPGDAGRRLRVGQPRQGRRDHPGARARARADPASGTRARRGGGRRHVARQRTPQGVGDRRGHRSAGGRRRHRARGRRPRRRPGVYAARYAGEGHLRRQPGEAAARARRRTDRRPASAPARGAALARRARSGGRGRLRRTHRRDRARGAGSATTRCSCPTRATGARSPRCPRTRSTPCHTAAAPSVRCSPSPPRD